MHAPAPHAEQAVSVSAHKGIPALRSEAQVCGDLHRRHPVEVPSVIPISDLSAPKMAVLARELPHSEWFTRLQVRGRGFENGFLHTMGRWLPHSG